MQASTQDRTVCCIPFHNRSRIVSSNDRESSSPEFVVSGLPGQSSYFCSVVEERRQIHVLTHALAQAL